MRAKFEMSTEKALFVIMTMKMKTLTFISGIICTFPATLQPNHDKLQQQRYECQLAKYEFSKQRCNILAMRCSQ